MTSRFTRLAATAACVLSMVLSGCEHKDLCYDHGHNVTVEVRIHWDAAPDADPNTMVVNFFSLDGKLLTCREFPSRDGGRTRIEAGEYMILFHNGEMDNVREATGAYDRYGLTTIEQSLLAPMSRDLGLPSRPAESADEPVRATAENVWAGKCAYAMFGRDTELNIVDLYPEEATTHYTVEVVNVENLRDNLDISAALSGQSELLNISTCSASGRPVTVPFKLDREKRKDGGEFATIRAGFMTFGHCPDDNTVKHILSIYTSDKVFFNFDVTDQVHNATDGRNIHIRIDGLKLPAGGQGLAPSIDGWGDAENVDINMS